MKATSDGCTPFALRVHSHCTTGVWFLGVQRSAGRPLQQPRSSERLPDLPATLFQLDALRVGTGRAPVTVSRGAPAELLQRERIEILPWI